MLSTGNGLYLETNWNFQDFQDFQDYWISRLTPWSPACASIFSLHLLSTLIKILIGFPRFLRFPRLLDFLDLLPVPLSLQLLSPFIKFLLGLPRLPRLLDFETVPGSHWLCCQCPCLLHFVSDRWNQELPDCQDSRISILSFYNMLPTLPGLLPWCIDVNFNTVL